MEGFANITGTGAENKTVDDWIEAGNKHFKNKDYDESIKCYFFGMMKEPLNIRLLSNRSAAYMYQGYYWLSLNDADLVLSKGDSMHQKGIFRKAKSLYGLARYEEGIQFIESIKKKTKPGETSKLKIYDELIKEGRTCMNQEKYGDPHYDILEMIKGKFTHLIRGEYAGPVKIGKAKGMGRGVFAREDIRPGQLIIAHRGFGVYFGHENDLKDDDKKNKSTTETEEEAQKYADMDEDEIRRSKMREKLSKLISKKLMTLDEEAGKMLTELYAADVGFRFSGTKVVTDHDMERIDAIVKHNAFFGDQQDDIFTYGKYICGLWDLPSYLNHSCLDSNCRWSIYGDFLMVRAFRSISKGEELLIPYVAPDMEFGKRTKYLSGMGVSCTCSLCTLDLADSEEIQAERKRLLELFETMSVKTGSERDLEAMSTLVQNIQALRQRNPREDVYSIKPRTKLAEWYFEIDKFEKAAKIFEKNYELLKGTVLSMQSVQFTLLNIVASYLQTGDHDKAHEWAGVLKRESQVAYGESIEWASEFYELFSSAPILHTVEWIKGNLIPI